MVRVKGRTYKCVPEKKPHASWEAKNVSSLKKPLQKSASTVETEKNSIKKWLKPFVRHDIGKRNRIAGNGSKYQFNTDNYEY